MEKISANFKHHNKNSTASTIEARKLSQHIIAVHILEHPLAPEHIEELRREDICLRFPVSPRITIWVILCDTKGDTISYTCTWGFWDWNIGTLEHWGPVRKKTHPVNTYGCCGCSDGSSGDGDLYRSRSSGCFWMCGTQRVPAQAASGFFQHLDISW